MAKTNDWIVANINNPNLDLYDLTTLGDMSIENTQFLSKDEYLKSSFIKNNAAFQDKDGNFSEEKFNNFYNYQSQRWGEFQESKFPEGLKLDYFDTRRTKDSRIKETNFNIGTEYNPSEGRFGNPDRVKIGIEAWNKVSDRTQSEKEIAQSQRIWDPDKESFLNETPEDSALFASPVKFIKSIFSDPVALAQYDEDTYDEFGYLHKKGELKLNDRGTYYYEKLNGRSPMNRQILSVGDILTKEDSGLNKIDFFDSDDLKKSVAGVVAKNVARVAPLFIPGVGAVYAKALIAKEMTRALPMLYGVGANLFGNESETPEWINTLGAKGEAFTSGSSVYASEHVFSFENFGNLVADVALQWGQQKAIAKAIQKLGSKADLAAAEKRAKALFDSKSKGKLAGMAEAQAGLLEAGISAEDAWKTTTLGKLCLEKCYEPVKAAMQARAKFGADLALAYMAIISNTDVYEDMLAKGGTAKEAAWVTLASTAGMFSVDKFAHIGELFFDDLSDDAIRESRKIVKEELESARKEIYDVAGKPTTPKGFWAKGSALGKKLGNKLGEYWEGLKDHSLGFVGKALGEGLEEVSEEAVTDTAKSIYSLLGDLGLYEANVENPIDWDTAFERYAMSFLGGAVGGGLFYGVEKVQNRYNPRLDRDLVDLIRDNKAADLRRLVNEYKAKGKIGSVDLSGYEYVKNAGDQSITWLSTTDKTKSQNDFIADRVLDKINSIEATIVGNNANLSDDELFDHLVLKEARYQQFKNASYATGYYQEFNKRLSDLVAAEQALKAANDTPDGNPATTKIETDSQSRHNPNQSLKDRNIQELQNKVAEAKQRLDDFLTGDTALEYTRKLNFILDPVLNSVFLDLNYRDWMDEHLDFDLNDAEHFDMQKMMDAQKGWIEHVQNVMASTKVDEGFKNFMLLEKAIVNPMLEQQEESKNYANVFQKLTQLYELNEESNGYKLSLTDYLKTHTPYTYNSRLLDENGVEETEDIWEARNTYDQTPDGLNARAKRYQRVADLNRQIYADYAKQFHDILAPINYQVDAASARAIIQSIQATTKDLIREEAAYPQLLFGGMYNIKPYFDILEKLNKDLSNVDVIKNEAKTRLLNGLQKDIVEFVPKISKTLGVPFNLKRTATDFSKKEFKNLVADLDDESVVKAIENIKTIETPIVSKYLANKNIETREDLEEFLLYLKKTLNNPISNLEYASEEDGAVADIIAGLADDVIAMSENELSSYENLREFGKALKDFTNNNIFGTIFTVDQLSETKNLEEIFNDFVSTIDGETSIQDIINNLHDNTSSIFNYLYSANVSLPNMILNILENENLPVGKDTPIGVLTGNSIYEINETISPSIKRRVNTLNTAIDNVVKRVASNPLYDLQNKLQVTLHSPIEKILAAITDQIIPNNVNVNDLLDKIYKGYINSDSRIAFELEPGQIKSLDSVKKALELVQAYIYAASTTPNGEHYFGQNKYINDFAANHKSDLVKTWNPLPEIDETYAALLNQEQRKLYSEVQLWRIISDTNSINKMARLVDTQYVLTNLQYETLKKVSGKFTIDDKEYDLLEGTEIPELSGDSTEHMNQLYQIEQIIHSNFNKIVNESGKPLETIFEAIFDKSGINFSDVASQKVTPLERYMKSLSGFDEAEYLLTILSDNPTDYYKNLKNQVEINNKLPEDKRIAPLTVQNYNSRLGEAAHTQVYKIGFKVLADKVKTLRTITPNIVHIDGIAGAGKTEVVLKDIRRRYKDDTIIVLGPTGSQATKLQMSLGESESFTFDEQDSNNLFRKLLGEQWITINNDIIKASKKLNEESRADAQSQDDASRSVDTEFFTLTYYKRGDTIGTRVDLKTDKLNFNKDFTQKLIFADEAAHMSAVHAAILDAYCEKVGGTAYFASDSAQSGYFKHGLENIGPTSLFCTRGARLTESLRSANIQMQENSNKMNKLLEKSDQVFNYGGEDEQKEWLENLPNLIKDLKFRVYNEDDINGYLTKAKSSEFIPKLKTIQDNANASGSTISIGFIGNSDSPLYQSMIGAGLKVSEPLTDIITPGKKYMQGQEFDYVIIDSISNLPNSLKQDYSSVEFLRRLNTLGTRGKVASIFVDDLTNLTGENSVDSQKSEGFSIRKQVAAFNDIFAQSLDKVNLLEVEEAPIKVKTKENPTPEKPTTPEVQTDEIVVETPEETPVELNSEVTTEELGKVFDEAVEESKEVLDTEEQNTGSISIAETTGNLRVQANTTIPITSLAEEKGKDGYSVWLPYDTSVKQYDKDGKVIRRNLQCFVTTDSNPNGIASREDKLRFQKYLSNIQSYILFGGKLPDIGNYISRLDWTKAKLQVELRPKNETDNFGIGFDFTNNDFIKIDGKSYVMAVICRIDDVIDHDTNEKYSAIFDISLLTDPIKLNTESRQESILSGIEKNIEKCKLKLTNPAISEEQKQVYLDQIARLQQEKATFPLIPKKYLKLVKDIINTGESTVIDLPTGEYASRRTSRLVKRKTPRRLGTHVSIANIENGVVYKSGKHVGEFVQDIDSFMDQDSRKVVSGVYIIGKQSDVLSGAISESILGKAVVFVSNNTNLSPDELPKMYIEQKLHPKEHSPEVRMIVLNNHGLSFSELVHNRIKNSVIELAQGSPKSPWRMDVLGVRMFTAMWNWRASLKNFKDALDKWMADKNYTRNKVNRIVEAEKNLYDQYKDKGERLENIILANGFTYSNGLDGDSEVTEKDLRNLLEFNLDYCIDIPIFRLGVDTTSDANHRSFGGYIRPFPIKGKSKVYKQGSTVNLFAISRPQIDKFFNILDVILNQLTANNIVNNSESSSLFKGMDTKLVHTDGTDFKINEYIGKDEQNRNLSGLIHTSNKTLVLGETSDDGKFTPTMSFSPEAIFSFFPRALTRIASRTKAYQANSSNREPGTSNVIKINTIDAENHEDYFTFDVSELFGENKLSTDDYQDNTLFNLFDLMFHGTTKSLEEWRKPREGKLKRPYLEDAFAKYGFFVDPDLEYSENYDAINIQPTGSNSKYTFLKCGTSPAYFDVDVDVIPGGIEVDLNYLDDTFRGIKSNISTEEKTPTQISELEQISGFAATLEGEEAEAFFEATENEVGIENTSEGYIEWKERNRIRGLKNIFDGAVVDGVQTINEQLKKQQTDIQIVNLTYENGVVKYIDANSDTGTLTLDMDTYSITVRSDSGFKVNSNMNMDTKIKLSDNTEYSASDFISDMYETFSNNDLVNNLVQIGTYEEFKKFVIDNLDSISELIYSIQNKDLQVTLLGFLNNQNNC